MKKIIAIILSVYVLSFTFAANLSSPVGYWKQYDDKTGKLQSIFQIFKTKNGTLSGKPLAGFTIAGKKPRVFCNDCSGKFKNKRITGLTILWGEKFENGYWQDGHILDPNSGSIYHAEMRLSQNGMKLNLRGYIGISLFGRTQVWKRIASKKELRQLMAKATPDSRLVSKK